MTSRANSESAPSGAEHSITEYPRSRWLRIMRWVLRRLFVVVVFYLLLLVMLLMLQRRLIYRPERVKELLPSAAGLATDRVFPVTYTTEDNLTINGWLALPSGSSAANVDEAWQLASNADHAVLFFSGNSRHRQYRLTKVQLLNDLGLPVLIFDYRGYGENPGSPKEAKLHADAQSIVATVTEKHGFATGKLILFGESLGGGVATRLAADLCRRGKPPAGLVIQASFSSLVDAASTHYRFLPVRLLLRDRYESDQHIPDVTAPYMHYHGDQDQIVLYSLGQKLFAAAPEASSGGIEKRFVTLPNGKHNGLLQSHYAEIQSAWEKFLADLNPPANGEAS